MKVPYSWLKEYVDIDITAEELEEKLFGCGFEVEELIDLGKEVSRVVVGEVLSCEPVEGTHLQICQVNCGSFGNPIQIVTGAPNVYAGMHTPAALDNSTLPGGITIKAKPLKGIPSDGMLCSGEELGLNDDLYPGAEVYGLMDLPKDTVPGTDIREVVGMNDYIFDISITANRPDCQSVLGIAREVAAARTGTIDKMHVLEGRALVHRGDTVLKGQTLITGILTDRQEEQRKVHAMGRVWAWTWYEKSLELPLQVWEKVYSGEAKKRYSLKIGDLRLNFYNDSSIYRDGYDKIQTENRAELFGLPLPICILKTEYRAYRLYEREMEVEESSALLEQELLQWLQETAPKAEILETWFRQEVADGILRLRMLSQCSEDIAVEREISAPSA